MVSLGRHDECGIASAAAKRTRAAAGRCGRTAACQDAGPANVSRSSGPRPPGEVADRLDVVGVVDQTEQIEVGLGQLDFDQGHPGGTDALEHRRQPGGPLRVVWTGVVVGERRVGEQHQVHQRTLAQPGRSVDPNPHPT